MRYWQLLIIILAFQVCFASTGGAGSQVAEVTRENIRTQPSVCASRPNLMTTTRLLSTCSSPLHGKQSRRTVKGALKSLAKT